MKSRVFGSKCGELLATYDHESLYWKTSQICFDWGEKRYLEALPKSGMMQNGQLSALVISERPIAVNAGFVLRTPTAKANQAKYETPLEGNVTHHNGSRFKMFFPKSTKSKYEYLQDNISDTRNILGKRA